MKRHFAAFGLVLSILAQTPGASAQPVSTYNGRSDFRLVILDRTPKASFKIEQDLINPPAEETSLDRARALMTSAIQETLLPVWADLNGDQSSVNKLALAMRLGGSLQTSLKGLGTSKAIREATVNGPIVVETFLIPWLMEKRDYFYQNEKVSSLGMKANVIGFSPLSPNFAQKIQADLATVRGRWAEYIGKKEAAKAGSGDAAYFLGYRALLHFDGRPGHEKENRVRIQLLTGLKATTLPFTQENDMVKFNHINVQQVAPETSPVIGPTAVITITAELHPQAPVPEMRIQLGDKPLYHASADENEAGFGFDKMNPKTAPKFEGQAKFKGKLTPVAIDFSFQNLVFDLTKLDLTKLELLTSPGLSMGAHHWVFGGFSIESVNSQFKDEINKTIDEEIAKAKASAQEKAQHALLQGDWVKKGMNVIFGGKSE